MKTIQNLLLAVLIILLGSMTTQCQPGLQRQQENIRWSFDTKQVSDKEFDLVFKADVDPKWHLYGPYQDYDYGLGPLPMEIVYDNTDQFSLVGRLKSSPKPERVLDDVFEVYVNQFDDKPVFTQRIRVNTDKPFVIKGEINGQICLDLCIAFDKRFNFQISGAKLAEDQEQTPSEEVIEEDRGGVHEEIDTTAEEEDVDALVKDEQSSGKKKEQQKSLLAFFFIALGLGVAGIFTPCVFPMIPMNIAFFLNYRGGKAKGKFLAVFYGLSIIFIYAVIGLLITVIFGAEAMNNIVTHWVTNVVFFLIFIVFAASFFGAFELMLPSKWVNKADSQADKGGLMGTFFMALTLVLVSFSCTAAFIGTILVEAADGTSLLKPFIGMLGFAVGFGVPFSLLALFPSVMQKMPRSGGWMNSVKVVFGFVILAFGMKFLVIPDQTYHLGLLNRDLYLAIWIVLFTLLGLYLLGKIRFHHDTATEHIGFFRLILVIIVFSFVVYLIPGMFGADLKGISSLLPPKSTLSLDLSKPSVSPQVSSELCATPSYSDFLHFQFDLEGYFDYDEAIACAKEKNKPVFIDFTGHGCSNCKVMEAKVWSDPRVLERFRNEFVMVALYTDDRTELPESKRIKSKDGAEIKTLGRLNKHIQETRFGTIATPLYVVIDHEGNMLSGTWQTSKDIDGFIAFLDDGIKNFHDNL